MTQARSKVAIWNWDDMSSLLHSSVLGTIFVLPIYLLRRGNRKDLVETTCPSYKATGTTTTSTLGGQKSSLLSLFLVVLDVNFEGPALLPDDPNKLKFAEEVIAHLDTFMKNVFISFKGDAANESGGEFDYLETLLQKFDDGPFFLGQFSQVDAAYVPFIERFQIFLQEVFNYDITSGRPKLAAYIEEMNKFDAYKQTKCDPKWLIDFYKARLAA